MLSDMKDQVLHLSELTKLSNKETCNLSDKVVLHLSELTKLSNMFGGYIINPKVLHLSELTKLSNGFVWYESQFEFYIFLN